jgi:hypothetical protein
MNKETRYLLPFLGYTYEQVVTPNFVKVITDFEGYRDKIILIYKYIPDIMVDLDALFTTHGSFLDDVDLGEEKLVLYVFNIPNRSSLTDYYAVLDNDFDLVSPYIKLLILKFYSGKEPFRELYNEIYNGDTQL